MALALAAYSLDTTGKLNGKDLVQLKGETGVARRCWGACA